MLISDFEEMLRFMEVSNTTSKDINSGHDFRLCPYNERIWPTDVLLSLSNLESRNSNIYDFFMQYNFRDGVMDETFCDFTTKFTETKWSCCSLGSQREVFKMYNPINNYLSNLYYELFTKYGTYLSKMKEELKSYSEFLNGIEIQINEWSKYQGKKQELDKEKSKIPNQEKTSSCLVF